MIEKRKTNKGAEKAQEKWSQGLGTKNDSPPICVKLPPDVDEIARSLPDRSAKLRQWIREGMEREGLLRPDSEMSSQPEPEAEVDAAPKRRSRSNAATQKR